MATSRRCSRRSSANRRSAATSSLRGLSRWIRWLRLIPPGITMGEYLYGRAGASARLAVVPELFDLCRRVEQRPSANLVAGQRDALSRPLADNSQRSGWRQRPHPPVHLPAVSAATAAARHEHWLAWICVGLIAVKW